MSHRHAHPILAALGHFAIAGLIAMLLLKWLEARQQARSLCESAAPNVDDNSAGG